MGTQTGSLCSGEHRPNCRLTRTGSLWAPQKIDRDAKFWKCLYPIARIHRLGGFNFLRASGRCRHGVAKKKSDGGAPVSHLGLSRCSDYFHCLGSDCNSRPGFSSSQYIRNRNSDRPHGDPCLLFLATQTRVTILRAMQPLDGR